MDLSQLAKSSPPPCSGPRRSGSLEHEKHGRARQGRGCGPGWDKTGTNKGQNNADLKAEVDRLLESLEYRSSICQCIPSWINSIKWHNIVCLCEEWLHFHCVPAHPQPDILNTNFQFRKFDFLSKVRLTCIEEQVNSNSAQPKHDKGGEMENLIQFKTHFECKAEPKTAQEYI